MVGQEELIAEVSGQTMHGPDHLQEPALRYARRDFPVIRDNLNVGEALSVIRRDGVGERIIYFYVINDRGQLVGIVPTRRLLTSMPSAPVAEIMIRDIVTIPHRATVHDACEMFVRHKFFAFPIVDDDNHVRGIIDIGFFSQETISVVERQKIEDIFHLIGVGIAQLRGRSALGLLRYRFPWLLTLVASGTVCAVITSMYEATLAQNLAVVFFMILVLGLGESVSTQSMTVALQHLHFGKPSWLSYFRGLKSEALTSALLGVVCGALSGGIAWLWRGSALTGLTVGASALLAIVAAGVIGLTVPTLLYAVREDSKIAAGPVTLALTDITTLLLYLNIARLLLG
jgi:magnesium transporter